MLTKEQRHELNKAKKLYKNKQYFEAKNIFDNLYNESSDDFDKWDKIFYSWALYYTNIKTFKSKEDLLDSVERVLELVVQEDLSFKDKACAYTLSTFKVINYFKDKKDYEELIYWLNKLNPKLLSEEQYVNYENKTFQSKKEKWYSLMSKSLIETEQFEKALDVSREALNNLSKFTDENEVWFKWKIAKSLCKLGEFDKSIDCLNEIVKFKKDWFIYHLFAENYFFKNDFDNALKYAVEGALFKGDIDKKTKLYLLLADIFDKKDLLTEAVQHKYLVYSVRIYNNWDIDSDLKASIEKEGLDLENYNYKSIERDLRKLWENLKFKDQEIQYGSISQIFSHGGSGFISSENGKSYYFNTIEFKDDKNNLIEGASVSFYLVDGFDKKKNEVKPNAVNIHIV